MKAPVVEPVHVGERLPFDVFDVAPRTATMNQLGLVETIEALGEGIVVGIAATANGGDDTGFAESLRVADAEILNAAVRVMDHPRQPLGVARVNRHLECVEREVTAQ